MHWLQHEKLLTDSKVNEHFPAVDPNKLLANQSNPDRVFSSEVLAGIYKKGPGRYLYQLFQCRASGE